jgi:hypothetical protein
MAMALVMAPILVNVFLSPKGSATAWQYMSFSSPIRLPWLQGLSVRRFLEPLHHKIPFIVAIEEQDMWLSPAVILTIGSVMTFVSLWHSPETKHLQLHEVGERERTSDPAKDLAGLPDTMCAD